MDEININESTFYNVGIKRYADLTLLKEIEDTNLGIELLDRKIIDDGKKIKNVYSFKISNKGETIALLLEMKFYKKNNETNENEIITPIIWSDNYFSLRGGESNNITVEYYNSDDLNNIIFEIIGWNCQLIYQIN